MTFGSLFSGAGLGDYGLEKAGLECKWQVEIDGYCRKILDLRWPDVPKFQDIKDFLIGIKSGIIEICNEDATESAQNVNSHQRQKCDPTVSPATQSEWKRGDQKIKIDIEKHKGTGVGKRKSKSSTITEESAYAAKKEIGSFSLSTTKMEVGTSRESSTNLKLGNLSEETNSPLITKSSVTTVTTPNNTTNHVRIEKPDLITAGVPCQPASVAGKRRGKSDSRWLWPETLEVIRLIKPEWVLLENPPGLLSLEQGAAFESICVALETTGYETIQIVFPAHALGAPHRRDRLWIVGHAGLLRQKKHEVEAMGTKQSSEDVSDSASGGFTRGNMQSFGGDKSESFQIGQESGSEAVKPIRFWETVPEVCRVVDVCSNRVDRLKALGNGQVVSCTEWIGTQLLTNFS